MFLPQRGTLSGVAVRKSWTVWFYRWYGSAMSNYWCLGSWMKLMHCWEKACDQGSLQKDVKRMLRTLSWHWTLQNGGSGPSLQQIQRTLWTQHVWLKEFSCLADVCHERSSNLICFQTAPRQLLFTSGLVDAQRAAWLVRGCWTVGPSYSLIVLLGIWSDGWKER